MGVPFARTAGVAPTWALVVALIASAAAVTADPPEDALVSTVQDALQTHARGDVDAALGKYDAIVDDAPAFARLSGTAAATVLNTPAVFCTRAGRRTPRSPTSSARCASTPRTRRAW